MAVADKRNAILKGGRVETLKNKAKWSIMWGGARRRENQKKHKGNNIRETHGNFQVIFSEFLVVPSGQARCGRMNTVNTDWHYGSRRQKECDSEDKM